MRIRGFEKVTEYANIDFLLPVRKTKCSAGYDFYLPEDVVLKPCQVNIVPTGVKAYMQDTEYLGMHLRSSIAMKMCLTMINSQGIIDSDYYYSDNFGHIMIKITTNKQITIKRNSSFCQGIILPFYKFSNEITPTKQRNGGFGSTTKKK